MVGVSQAVGEVLRDYRQCLEQSLPGRVLRVTLFGSVARGEAHEESDVDVLVLVDRLSFAERSRAIELAAEVGLDRGFVISPLVLTRQEWETLIARERLLPREIERDGIDVDA